MSSFFFDVVTSRQAIPLSPNRLHMPHRQTHHRPCMTSPHAKNSWSTSTWTRRGRRWSRRHVTIFNLNFGFWNKYFWKQRAHSYQKYVVNLPNKVIQTDTRMYALTNMKIKADKPLKMANPHGAAFELSGTPDGGRVVLYYSVPWWPTVQAAKLIPSPTADRVLIQVRVLFDSSIHARC